MRAWFGVAVVLAVPCALVAWQAGTIHFEDVSQKSGAKARHHTRIFKGPYGDVLRMFTSGGAAAAAGDYDGDGRDDLFVTDSDEGKSNHLFHNDGNMTFTEVTDAAGVGGGNDPRSIVADALWFDYDNDGKQDLLVVRFNTPLLYHNDGAGKFRDVTRTSGINRFGNTIAAIAFDYDGDGNLDVMLGNYFKPVNLIDGKDNHVLPNNLDNAINGGGITLWKGNGQGAFVDVTARAGFAKHTGWTLDLGHGDFNNDGLQDVYIACDYGTDRVFFNNGNGTFQEVTEKAISYDTRKGMNVDIADYDNDGWLDVYVTNITDEYMKECNMLWHNEHDGTFTDVSKETNTCATLWGWAAKFGDYDNDGWQDLFVVNGLRSARKGEGSDYIPHVLEMINRPGVDFTDVKNWPQIGDMTWSGYQKKKFLHNLANGSFKEMSTQAGVDNDKDGRGLAISDFDGDGMLDIYQTNADQDSIFYRNNSTGAGHWVEFQLTGTGKSNRDAIGARVTIGAGRLTQIAEVNGGNGYAGQSSRRLHFGLGTATALDRLEIRWPDGKLEKIASPGVMNRVIKIVEGKGVVSN